MSTLISRIALSLLGVDAARIEKDDQARRGARAIAAQSRRGCDLRSAPAAWSRSPAARRARRRDRRRMRLWARRCACAGSWRDHPATASSRATCRRARRRRRIRVLRQRRERATIVPRASPYHMLRAMALPRMHLFEFNDSPWAPRAIRDTIIESLSRTLSWGRLLAGLVAPFEEFVARAGVDEVLDVCAGAAGPARILVDEIRSARAASPRASCSPIYSRTSRNGTSCAPSSPTNRASSRDRSTPPPSRATSPAGARASSSTRSTTSRPRLAQSILRDAVDGSAGIFIAEPWERNPLRFATFIPHGVAALAVNPFLSPRDRLQKALLTFATPAIVAASVWDGLVSTMRVYSRDELESMVAPLGDRFTWTWGYHEYALGGRGYYFWSAEVAKRCGHRRAAAGACGSGVAPGSYTAEGCCRSASWLAVGSVEHVGRRKLRRSALG